MRIDKILKSDEISLSFEVFPPKTDSSFESVKKAVGEIAGMYPSFMSVTYGAGGGTSDYTLNIARSIKEIYSVESLAHLTCISSTKDVVKQRIADFKNAGIENILALRGDIPSDGKFGAEFLPEYRHATELIADIKSQGDFCIGCACYPETHPESASQDEDIAYLKLKQDAGCNFFTTQMFFDNDIFYKFYDLALNAGVNVPIAVGLMPITNIKQLERAATLSNSFIPDKLKRIADKFGSSPEAMKQAGVHYCIDQIIDLIASGVTNIHIYSMNKPDCARMIKNAVDPLRVKTNE